MENAWLTPKQKTGSRKKEKGMRRCATVSRVKRLLRVIFSFAVFKPVLE